MTSGISLAGIDPTFDYIVSVLAPKRVRYTASQYPDFNAMKKDFEATGVLSINVDYSDSTIFGAPSTNWQFRAWHDSQHIAANSDFSDEGEATAARRQQDQVVFLNGPSWSDKKRWIALIDCEVNGQLAYLKEHGEFPSDQRAFACDYLLRVWGIDVATFPKNLDKVQVEY